jgi:hypothetical protein
MENDETDVSEPVDHLRDFIGKRGHVVDRLHVNGALDESRTSIITPHIHKHSLPTGYDVTHSLGLQLFDTCYRFHSIGQGICTRAAWHAEYTSARAAGLSGPGARPLGAAWHAWCGWRRRGVERTTGRT